MLARQLAEGAKSSGTKGLAGPGLYADKMKNCMTTDLAVPDWIRGSNSLQADQTGCCTTTRASNNERIFATPRQVMKQ